jgi:hypothetical protein
VPRFRVPEAARGRVATILLLTPFVAGAIVYAVTRIALLHVFAARALDDGDRTVGFPLAAITGAALVGIVTRSVQVWRGAQTDFPRVLRIAPFLGLAGAIVAAFATAGR